MQRYSLTLLRHFSIALITLTMLVQVSLLAHEVEHKAPENNRSCEICQLADNQIDFTTDRTSITLKPITGSAATCIQHSLLAKNYQFYFTRAPPMVNHR